MTHKHFRIGALGMLFLLVGLACNLSQIGSDVNTARGTAQALITQAQGFATDTGELVSTAQGFATDTGELVSTAQAFATQNPGLVQTAQAFATNQGPALIGTAQALATENPGLVSTLQAIATQGFDSEGSLTDIPMLPEDQVQEKFSSGNTLTYSTPTGFQEVVDFYKLQMPANGWTLDESSSFSSEGVSFMKFTKDGRTASMNISRGQNESVTYISLIVTGG